MDVDIQSDRPRVPHQVVVFVKDRNSDVNQLDGVGCGGAGFACSAEQDTTDDRILELFGASGARYTREDTYRYVGPRRGSYEKLESVKKFGSQLRPNCLCRLTLFLASLVALAAAYFSESTVAPLTTTIQQSHDKLLVRADCSGRVDTWEPQHRIWCCQHRSVGCSEQSVGAGSAGNALLKKPSAVANGIPKEVRFNCSDAGAMWPLFWSVSKAKWCCQSQNRGCSEPRLEQNIPGIVLTKAPSSPFECIHNFSTWDGAWSMAKRRWCCRHAGVGCPTQTPKPLSQVVVDAPGRPTQQDARDSKNDHATPLTTTHSSTVGGGDPELSTVTKTTTGTTTLTRTTTTDKTETVASSTSENQSADDVSASAQAFLAPAPLTPVFDCSVQGPSPDPAWSEQQRAWCCAKVRLECRGGGGSNPSNADFNCVDDYFDWYVQWSHVKQEWCCRMFGRGCIAEVTLGLLRGHGASVLFSG